MTVPALFIAIGGLFVGQLLDRLGRKPLLIASTLLYGFAGSSGLVLNSLGTLLVGRAILGLAVAGIMTGVTTLIADYYTGQKRADFMGLQAAFMGLGGVAFLSVGGLVADLNWRFPFLIYLSAWAVAGAISITLYEPKRAGSNGTKLDSADSSRMPTGVLAMIYGVALFYMLAFYLIPIQLPFYLQNLSNASATASGLAIAASTLASGTLPKKMSSLLKLPILGQIFVQPTRSKQVYTETVFLELVDNSPLAYLAAKSSKETCLILLALPAVPKAS